jgi:hypothetical protein
VPAALCEIMHRDSQRAILKLSEFSLWAYKLELSEARAFTLESRCVCAHFERHFEGIATKDIYRIVIKLGGGDAREGTTELSSSVLKYYENFNFSYFYKQSWFERKEILLNTLCDSLLKICQKNDWPTEPFERAKEKVIEDKFNNSYEVSRKKNKSRSMVAYLNAEHTTDRFTLDLIVKDKLGTEILRKPILSEEPDEFLFNGQIGRIQWASNEVLNYIAKDKSVLETIEVEPHG